MIDKSIVKTWRALAVDDDPDSLEVIRFTLNFHGAEVVTKTGGKQAIKALESFKPNIVFLDLSMPDVDGWEVMRHIKKKLKSETTPVIALTAHAMKGDRERVLEAGFDYYMTKPFSPVTFVDELLGLIATKSNGTRLVGEM